MRPVPHRPKGQPNRLKAFHLPAPLGGVNTISPGTDMPKSDSIYSYNLIGAEFGLRTRLGWREYVTGLDGEVRSLLPFTGSTKDGATSRLFACTMTGIWDVTASTAAPAQVVAFPTQGNDAGWGASTVMVTPAGHFLVYTDEANGLYVYRETGGTWSRMAKAAETAWQANTLYAAGDYVLAGGLTYLCTVAGRSRGAAWAAQTAYVLGDVRAAGGKLYTCTQAGNSAASGAGPAGTGVGIADGSCTWAFLDGAPAGTGGAIVDGTATWAYVLSISGVDPALLVNVVAWKNRLWFTERDSARGWYLDINAIGGAAVSFNFGGRFKAGGDLRGLWSWTYDGGSGIDDALVAVSGGGDVVIYKGTDPSSAATFGLVGVWFVGAVPAGRRLCTDFGGDLLVMSSLGILPLSKLVTGNILYERSQYQTAKIANLFGLAQAATSQVRGWAMRLHPADACLMVLVPTAAASPSQQFVMSLATRGWHVYRDMPMGACAEPWGGTLYFGTPDGRVCVNDGYLDGVLLADPSAYQPIQWSLLTAFSNLGSPTQKRVATIRPRVLSQGGAIPCQAAARFGFDLQELLTAPASAGGAGATWDAAKWDAAVWGGSYQAQAQVWGATGYGIEVAIAVRGASTSRMTLVGIDVSLETGGLL